MNDAEEWISKEHILKMTEGAHFPSELAFWKSDLGHRKLFKEDWKNYTRLKVIAEIGSFALDGIPSGRKDHSFKA